MREVIRNRLCVLRSLHGLPGRAVSWNRQDCNMKSVQRGKRAWSIVTGLCPNVRTQNVVFQNAFSLFRS